MKVLALCLCAALLSQACGMPIDTTDALPLGSHSVSVRPKCISKQINNQFPGTDKIYNLTCGETKVTIKNEELSVNGRTYGVLNAGDSVHVNNGKVYINAREVSETAHR